MQTTDKTIQHINQFLAWYNRIGHYHAKSATKKSITKEVVESWRKLREAKLTYDFIARQSGVSHGVVYRHLKKLSESLHAKPASR